MYFCPYRAVVGGPVYPGRCPGLCSCGLSARWTSGRSVVSVRGGNGGFGVVSRFTQAAFFIFVGLIARHAGVGLLG